MAERPLVSVVFITMGENTECLQEALSSCEKHAVNELEIIVSLVGPQPRSKAVARAYGARTVEVPPTSSFSEGMNAGLVAARGDYIVGSNDDVIYTRGWDTLLIECLDQFHQKVPMPRAGLVGPSSNFVGGVQHVGVPNLTPDTLQSFAVEFASRNAGAWVPTDFISGFCFMMTREFYEETVERDGYFFDAATFPRGGAEDNDLSVRTVRAGYSLVHCAPCYIWHHGSRTLQKFPELQGGMANLIHLYRKWLPEEPGVLGALYRVKITENYQLPWFLESLEQTAKFADRIYLLDDGSADWAKRQISLALFKLGDQVRWTRDGDPTMNEGEQRQELYRAAADDGCDWVISVDGDEVFEDRFDYEYAHRLMMNPDPSVNAYTFHWYHLWNSEERYRGDGLWAMQGTRMARVLPNYLVPPLPFHCGNIPLLADASRRTTSIRVKHYGNMLPEDRQRKFEFYEEADVEKNPTLIGNSDYSHLLNENGAGFLPWEPKTSVSVTTIVKNEELQLHAYFQRLWSFADEIVLGDTGSTDATLELCRIWGAKVVPIEFGGGESFSFGRARNRALDACSGSWVLHLDADERVENLMALRRMMDEPRYDGYMFYVDNLMPDGRKVVTETVRLFRNLTDMRYLDRLVHETLDTREKTIARSPISVIHLGYLKPQPDMKAKFAFYLRQNLRQFVRTPEDAQVNYNLAHHFHEGGLIDIARFLMERSADLDPKFFQASQALAVMHIEEAHQRYQNILKTLSPNHAMYPDFEKASTLLSKLRDQRTPIDHTHVLEVLQEEEFHPLTQQLVQAASGVS